MQELVDLNLVRIYIQVVCTMSDIVTAFGGSLHPSERISVPIPQKSTTMASACTPGCRPRYIPWHGTVTSLRLIPISTILESESSTLGFIV